MPEMDIRQPGFTYSACGPFTKTKEWIKEIKKQEIQERFTKKKTCFQHELAYGYFKDLNRRTFAEKVLQHKAFSIARNPKYDGYQRALA